MFDHYKAISEYVRKNKTLPSLEELVRLSDNTITRGKAHVILEGFEEPIKRKVKSKKGSNPAFYILQGVLFFISGVAAVVSVYYSFLWLESYMIEFLAGALASALVLFATTGFTISRYVERKGIKALLVVMSSFVLLFSMVCTIAGQIKVSSSERNTTENGYYNVEIEIIEKQIAQTEIDLENAQDLLDQFKTIEDRAYGAGVPYYNSMQDRTDTQERLDRLNQDLREQIQLKMGNDTDEGFFDFIKSLREDRINLLKFLLYLLPAIFLDIIAPLGLVIVFEMKKEGV